MRSAERVVPDIPREHRDLRPIASGPRCAALFLQLLDQWGFVGPRAERQRTPCVRRLIERGASLVDVAQQPGEGDVDAWGATPTERVARFGQPGPEEHRPRTLQDADSLGGRASWTR